MGGFSRTFSCLLLGLVPALTACRSSQPVLDRRYSLRTFQADLDQATAEGSLSMEQALKIVLYDAQKCLQGNQTLLNGRTYRQLLQVVEALPADSLVIPDPVGPLPPPPPRGRP